MSGSEKRHGKDASPLRQYDVLDVVARTQGEAGISEERLTKSWIVEEVPRCSARRLSPVSALYWRVQLANARVKPARSSSEVYGAASILLTSSPMLAS